MTHHPKRGERESFNAMPFDGRICPINTCRFCGRTFGVVGDTFCDACATAADVAAFEERNRQKAVGGGSACGGCPCTCPTPGLDGSRSQQVPA